MTLTFPEERRSGGSVGLRSNGSSRFASMCLLFCALVWYGEPNMSHKIAPVDRGGGKTLRSVGIREGLEVWLEEKDNRKLWTRKRISPQMKREPSKELLGCLLYTSPSPRDS